MGIRFAQVPERVSTKSFVVLILRNSRVESLKRTGHVQPRTHALLVRMCLCACKIYIVWELTNTIKTTNAEYRLRNLGVGVETDQDRADGGEAH